MDLLEVNTRYGRFMWSIAKRYHTGIWSEEDVYSQLLIAVHAAVNGGKVCNEGTEPDEQVVKSFIITRAIDILRVEKVRRNVSIHGARLAETRAAKGMSPEAEEWEVELIRELLFTRLDEKTARFIFELAFPSPSTVAIALEEQALARLDEDGLRMNIHELKITSRHVAISLGPRFGRTYSRATIARMKAKAQEAVYKDRFESKKTGELGDIVDQIIGDTYGEDKKEEGQKEGSQ